MISRYAIFAGAAFLFACSGLSATAGEDEQWDHGGHRRATRHAIYELENVIAVLEADPQADEGYKAPVIGRARADVARLHATLPRPQWRWVSPCCYSRRPIYIR